MPGRVAILSNPEAKADWSTQMGNAVRRIGDPQPENLDAKFVIFEKTETLSTYS